MSARLTLGSVKDDVAEILGVCSDDARVARRVNEAQERLLNRPNAPVGAKQRYRLCTSQSCVTFPRQIRTVETFWLCNTPGLVVDEWFEAVGWREGGLGLLDSDGYNGSLLLDRGTSCCFDNVASSAAAPRKIQAVASDPSDNGKYITLRYVDSNGQRVYTEIDGVIQEGERLTLSTAGVLTGSGGSSNGEVFTNGLYHVVKAVTNYPVRLYSYDVTSGLQIALLACYEPSETLPLYRRSFVPGITQTAQCNNVDDTCATRSITVAVRLQHVPVVVDNDPLILTNLPALLDMVKSIELRRNEFYQEAQVMEANAMRELDGEQAAYTGDGALVMLRFPEQTAWAGGGIYNPIP